MAALSVEQAGLVKSEYDREEQQRQEIMTKQREKIAHNKVIAEKVVLASYFL